MNQYLCPGCHYEMWPKKKPRVLPRCGCGCLMEPVVPIKWSIKGSLACPNCGCQNVSFGAKCPSCDEVHN